jgi:hypothetical protein
MAMPYAPTRSLPGAVIAGAMLLGIAGCGDRQSPAPEAAAPVAGQQSEAAPPAEIPAEAAAAAEAETAMDERAAELAAREEELAARERELAEREAAAAAKAAQPARTAATPKPVSKEPPKAPAPVEAAPPPPPPPPVAVAAGTPVSVKLNSSYSTNTTTVGQTVNAELASDLVVDGRPVARAGAPISGTVTEVTSGSKKVGAVPALKIDFTQLVVADGSTMPVAIRINQKGQSEKGRDTAKIAGGAAAGAIIGHQIDDDKGKVIGGILGGAAGAVGAHKTGTEVELPAGTVLNATVRSEFVYQGR